jgi:release factor glutamine methyltransferase
MKKKTPISPKERHYLSAIESRDIQEIYLEDINLVSDSLDRFYQVRDVINSDYPLDYIIGKLSIPQFGFSLELDSHVLIPREETIDWMQQILSQNYIPRQSNVVEIGTGSGLISIILAQSGYRRLLATDISHRALELAQINATNTDCRSIQFVLSDLLGNSEILDFVDKSEWILISNPPYVPESDKHEESYNSIKFEPELALFGGEDGLVLVRRLIDQIKKLENKPQLIVLELDPRNISSVKKLLEPEYQCEIWRDFNNLERTLLAKKVDNLM